MALTVYANNIDVTMFTMVLVSIFTGSCFACGISFPLCFIIAQVPKQKKTHGTQFFQIDAAGFSSPLCAVHCFWCMRVLC